jgi:SAM-dependent methyltransferase
MCDANDHTNVCSRSRNGTTYRVVRCASCGFHYVNPEPDDAELLVLYDAEYSERHCQTWHGFEDEVHRQVIGALQRRGVRSLADLGAGQGRFVRHAVDAGIDAHGIEPSALNCEVARDRYNVTLRRLTVQQFLAGPARDLDCITMLNVLEHVPDPLSVLRQSADALRPSGVLAIVVPNVDFTLLLGRLRRAAGASDIYMLDSPRFSQQGFDPPIHLSSFDARHLRSAVARAGLRIEILTQAAVIRSANPLARIAKRSVSMAGRGLEILTGGRVVWGYSLLCIARRP